MATFRGPDGTPWRVVVQTPGSTNATVVFVHPDPNSSSLNRYAWYISDGAGVRSVTSRLSPKEVLESLNERDLARLFRRSMPIGGGYPQLVAG
jgi:hypothetical protein